MCSRGEPAEGVAIAVKDNVFFGNTRDCWCYFSFTEDRLCRDVVDEEEVLEGKPDPAKGPLSWEICWQGANP